MADGVSLRDYYDALWEAHHREHTELSKELDLARENVKEKLTEMNQFRSQIDRERALYVTSDKLDSKVGPLETRLKQAEEFRSNMEGRMWMLAAIVGGGLTVATIGINLLFKFWPK